MDFIWRMVNEGYKDIVVSAPTGCHAKGHQVLRANGQLVAVENVKCGDWLLGPDGSPRLVMALCRGTDEMYTVKPVKGEPFTINSHHLLHLQRTNDGWNKAYTYIDVPVNAYAQTSHTFKHIHKLCRSEAIAGIKRELLIPPYILGLWLGDGHSAGPTLTNGDAVIQHEWLTYGKNLNLKHRIEQGQGCLSISLVYGRGGNYRVNKLLDLLRHYDLQRNKHIPLDYLTSSVTQRLELLAGLMDTDGSLADTCFDFIQVRQHLSEQTAYIARSLGLSATVSECEKTCQTGARVQAWRVCISGDTHLIPTKITAKHATARNQIKSVLRTGFSIMRNGIADYYGFQVSNDHLYLDSNFTIQHNCGKTAIGMAACLWAASPTVHTALNSNPGGYYLVTQKLLQDQINSDFERFPPRFVNSGITLKSAIEYSCKSHHDCYSGHQATKDWLKLAKEGGAVSPSSKDPESLKPCLSLIQPDTEHGGYMRNEYSCCAYELHMREFATRPIGVTNYAYWFSERAFVGLFPDKNVLVADECHSIERQLLGLVELGVNANQIKLYGAGVDNHYIDTATKFLRWLDNDYAPAVDRVYSVLRDRAAIMPHNMQLKHDLQTVENHMRRFTMAAEGLKENPENWVYWCEQDGKDGFQYIVKPLNAAPYFKKIIQANSTVRIYMSAYPGPKNLFCRTLGLDPVKVAWKNLGSTFPVANRPIHLDFVGSMGRKAYDETLPKLLCNVSAILNKHANEKGLIHCHSYKLGKAIHEHLMCTPHGVRILFPPEAKNRAELFHRHRNTTEPTVLLSPSMTEGFSLDDELARFQIIAKMPYPYLGDRQIAAKKELDPDWYLLQTIMTIIQACGRIVRSDTDFGETYILDRDFTRLYNDDNLHFFPRWFVDSFVWR